MSIKKRLLLISDYYKPEVGSPQIILEELVKNLKNTGFEVEICTTHPNYPHGKIYEGYRNKLYSKSIENGIKTHRFYAPIFPNNNQRYRLIRTLLFAIFTSFLIVFEKRYSVVIAHTPMPFTLIPGLLAKRLSYVCGPCF